MILNKTTIFIAVVILVLTAGVFWVVNNFNNQNQNIPGAVSEERIMLRADKGFNLRYAGGTELVVTERYRLYDDVAGKNIDITADNAKITIIKPDGETQEINNEYVSFFPMNIIPPSMPGEYKFVAKMHSGEEYSKTFQFNEPRETGLTPVGGGNKFSLGGLDLKEAVYVMHIFPGGDVLDAVLDENKDIVLEVDNMKIGEHIIMAKINNTWHYARVSYPTDF